MATDDEDYHPIKLVLITGSSMTVRWRWRYWGDLAEWVRGKGENWFIPFKHATANKSQHVRIGAIAYFERVPQKSKPKAEEVQE